MIKLSRTARINSIIVCFHTPQGMLFIGKFHFQIKLMVLELKNGRALSSTSNVMWEERVTAYQCRSKSIKVVLDLSVTKSFAKVVCTGRVRIRA